jgi:hypothetical protein
MMVMMALVTTFMTTPILVAVTGNSMPAEAVAIDENRERLLLSARKAEGL